MVDKQELKTNSNKKEPVLEVVGQIAMDTLVEQIVPDVSKKMTEVGVTISPSSVMQVLRLAMEAVEGAPIKGPEQKELAIKIVLEIAKGADLPEEHMFLISNLIDGGLVSDTIDLIIDATRGKLNINQVTVVAQGCFAKCFSAIFRRNKRGVRGQVPAKGFGERSTLKGVRGQVPAKSERERISSTTQAQTSPAPVSESVVSQTTAEEALVMMPPKMTTGTEDVDVVVNEEEQKHQNEEHNEETTSNVKSKAPLKNQLQFQLKK